MLVYLIRHGESAHNAEGRIQGHSDVPLSAVGLRQSEALADALGGLAIDAIYCSPLRRAMQTAEPIAASLGLPIIADARLMEIHVGIFQDRLRRELDQAFPAEMARWSSGDPDFRIPGGESRRELAERARAAFDSIAAAGHQAAIVVSHGGPLAAALKSLLEIPICHHPLVFQNAGISTIELGGNNVKLLTLNQVEHLRTIGISGAGDL